MKNIINIIVKDAENGKRIDSFISKKEKMLSQSVLQSMTQLYILQIQMEK